MKFNIQEAVQAVKLKKVAQMLSAQARKDRSVAALVRDLEKGVLPKNIASFKKNDDVTSAFAEVMGPEETMKAFNIKEETYSPQKHEWGTDASRKFAKKKTPGQKDVEEAKYGIDIEGLPRFYMDGESPGKVKNALRRMLKKPDMIKDVERTPDSKVKADFRDRISGKKKADDMKESKLKKDKDDPCWDGYVQLGTKKKNGKEVPNCVPKEETEVKEAKEYFLTGLDYKGTKHTYKRRGPKMTDPIVVYIDGKEWKTFKSMSMAKKETLNYIKGMKEEVEMKEQNDTTEKVEMAQTQLHFIGYACDEILEFIEMGGVVEEWYQNKLSKVHSDMEGLHSYIEGEMRRTGMKEETDIDEGRYSKVPTEKLKKMTEAKIPPDTLKKLRAKYGKIEKIDPSSESYKKLKKFITDMDKGQLQSIADANIKWLSMIAQFELKKK